MLSDIQIGPLPHVWLCRTPRLSGDVAEALADEVTAAITDDYQSTYDQRDTDGISGHYLPMASRYTR